uniref:Uncharacterized protein n=1 Tax=Arundo donax TaxID=35708 RepID=A0A0A9BIW5_ARUDO
MRFHIQWRSLPGCLSYQQHAVFGIVLSVKLWMCLHS